MCYIPGSLLLNHHPLRQKEKYLCGCYFPENFFMIADTFWCQSLVGWVLTSGKIWILKCFRQVREFTLICRLALRATTIWYGFWFGSRDVQVFLCPSRYKALWIHFIVERWRTHLRRPVYRIDFLSSLRWFCSTVMPQKLILGRNEWLKSWSAKLIFAVLIKNSFASFSPRPSWEAMSALSSVYHSDVREKCASERRTDQSCEICDNDSKEGLFWSNQR